MKACPKMSFRLGPIPILHPFCQAGLAGYSDRAMRIVARRRGCPYALTESLLDTIMLCGGMGLKKSIDINEQDHPVAGQIVGSDPETMAPAAKILHDRGYDVIDLNFACKRGGLLHFIGDNFPQASKKCRCGVAVHAN